MSQQQAERIADTVLEAIETNDTVVVRLNEEIEVETDVLKAFVGEDDVAANVAMIVIGTRVFDKLVDALKGAREVARKRLEAAKVPPPKDFYPLDEAVPGGRHEVRLLRHNGRAVGRYVVPMDGEWSPKLETVNEHHARAVAAYEAQRTAGRFLAA